MLNYDDWELFVPVKGEKYAGAFWRYKDQRDWRELVFAPVVSTEGIEFRRPKQKETKMPDRTPQQALKDAIDSGAVKAWINGEDIQCRVIQYRVYHPEGSEDGWVHVDMQYPDFSMVSVEYRPEPPEPTKINWQPMVTGKEPQGEVLAYWGPRSVHISVFKDGYWRNAQTQARYQPPAFYATMCNLPEGDE